MPQLPKKNTLDYNPDSTVNASKQLSVIALQNMKNPLEDPDQSTLSTIRKESDLKKAFERLEDLAGTFQSVLLRLQNLEAKRFEGAGLRALAKKLHGKGRGGMLPSSSRSSRSDVSSYIERLNEGRMLAAASEYADRLNADRQRFSNFYRDDDRNSFATPSTMTPDSLNTDEQDPVPNARTPFQSPDYEYFGDDFTIPEGYPYFPDPDMSSITEQAGIFDFKQRDWTSLIFYLIQLLRRIDILVNSSIKPQIQNLSSSQVKRLTDIYSMIFPSYDDLIMPLSRRLLDARRQDLAQLGQPGVDPFSGVRRNLRPELFEQHGFGMIDEEIIQENQYGDEILNTFNTERRNLLLDLTVIINSWRQNTPTGQQTELNDVLERDFVTTTNINEDLARGAGRKPRGRPKKTGQMTLIGCGHNFYGEKINDSRDVPCLLSSIRNCPTKYLL